MLEIVRNDITKRKVDVIVNAVNELIMGGGDVDGAIRRVAGSGLLAECRTLQRLQDGQGKDGTNLFYQASFE